MPHKSAAFFMLTTNSEIRTPESFRERIFKQNERVMKFGLDAMRRATESLGGLPHYPTFLIAGTNGKGQVSATLSVIAQNLGFTTGLFTSPHLIDFSERIRVNGCRLEDTLFNAIGWEILDRFGGTDDAAQNAARRDDPQLGDPVLTYFECCFAMALEAFKRTHVNLGVFEVGLGGRLDATNILEPDISIITSISLDHMQYLGNTVEQIAREKAGIMRAGKPVIIGRQTHDVLREEAQKRGASALYALGEDFDWQKNEEGTVELVAKTFKFPMFGTEHMADYQLDNAAVALFAAHIAHQCGLFTSDPTPGMAHALTHTRWVGRMYNVPDAIAQSFDVQHITLDGAHNQDGVRCFCNAVAAQNCSPRALIVNSCGDKAIDEMFPQYLNVFVPQAIFVSPLANPRAMNPHDYCTRTGLPPEQACSTMDEALERAAKYVGSTGTIYISGSLYLLGDVLKRLKDDTVLNSIQADSCL